MSGHHSHHHIDPEAGDARVAGAIAVNFLLTVAQIVGGIVSGSLALIADALHNLSDAVALVIAFAARRIARRPNDAAMTFGYGRIEHIAALINYTTLILIGLYLAYEAIWRFVDPPGVTGWIVVAVAGVALVVDLVTALLTFRLSRQSVNIRAAFLHNVADALGSVAVIVAGTLILLYDWRLADPLITLAISGYILWQSVREIGPVIRLLMLGSPPDLDSADVLDAMRSVDGVEGVHHTHIWQLGEHENAIDSHLVIAGDRWSDADAIKASVRDVLRDRFQIGHTTLELEQAGNACEDRTPFGAH